MTLRGVFLFVLSVHPLLALPTVYALDINDVQWVTLDFPPSAYVMLQRPGESTPLMDEFGLIGFDAFVDTGSSGVLLSREVAEFLGVQQQLVNGTGAVFSNVGVGGAAAFNVSEPLNVGLAPFHPDVVDHLDDLATLDAVYSQRVDDVRAQFSTSFSSNPVSIVGMALLEDKVVVIDPSPVDRTIPNFPIIDTTRTYIYDQGTSFNAEAADRDPGIPPTSHNVQLSYGDFSRFTSVSPANAEPPSLAHNPFIGPDPVSRLDPNPPTDDTPPVTIAFHDLQTSGSFLFDTAASSTFISMEMARDLEIRYRPGSFGTGSPRLETYDPDNPGRPGVPVPDQFQVTIAGIGGNVFLSGFYLDSMLLRTVEGNAADDSDPNHLNFERTPVLVDDIQLRDPASGQVLTFDGIFGMNNLVPSAIPTQTFPFRENLAEGSFDWIVFDEAAGRLGLTPKIPPTPVGPDFDGDGEVDSDDVDALVGEIVAGTHDLLFDLSDDGLVDDADLSQWLGQAATINGFTAPYLPGDSNLDGSVNALDLNNLALSCARTLPVGLGATLNRTVSWIPAT